MNQESIQSYFLAEKSESLLFLIVGILAISFSIVAYFIFKKPFFTGLAVPLLLVGLIQVVVGGTVYFRSDKQMADLTEKFEKDKIAFAKEELPRMETVNLNFKYYKYLEIFLLVLSIILLFWKFGDQQSWVFGVGIGLFLQSALMLIADFFAESRALVYTDLIQKLL